MFSAHMSGDDLDALLSGKELMARVRTLEGICAVYWPKYNWKLMRALYMDKLEDINAGRGAEYIVSCWEDRLIEVLMGGQEGYLAALSVGLDE